MSPSKKLLRYLLFALALAVALLLSRLASFQLGQMETADSALSDLLLYGWAGYIGSFIFAIVIDAYRDRKIIQFGIERQLPHSMALGVSADVQFTIENPYPFDIELNLTDSYPVQVEAPNLPLSLELAANSKKMAHYEIIPVKRGDALFGSTCVRVFSRWGFWERQLWFGESDTAKVYPNYSAVSHLAKFGFERQIAHLGVHIQQRRGEGSDFHQLREFREGDAMRQIDWKASARYRKPISRDYQDERDQNVVFLLDCGRQLRNQDDRFSHFDHALNALLLTAYIALRQGDAVGLMSFAGDERWLSPKKGSFIVNQLLNQLYDLQSTTATSDYLQAAEQLLSRYLKRSLVVLITNIQESASEDLIAAVKLLQKKHVVLVASLRNGFLDEFADTPITQFGEALDYCETAGFLQRRERQLKQLRSSGVTLTDTLPKFLHIGLVNEYLKIKRSGRL